MIFKKRVILELIALLLIAAYVAFFSPSILLARNDAAIGYADLIEYIRALDDTLKGGVIFKDFFWGYGPFFLYLQILPYIFLGQNHQALLLILFSLLPLFAIFLSYLWSLVFFRSAFFRILFVLTCIFHYVNCMYASTRHLMAEVAIASFIFWLLYPQRKIMGAVSGALVACAIFTSQEYGLAALVAILISSLFVDKRRFAILFAGFFGVVTPTFLYLLIHGALYKYFVFSFGYVRNFGNPAGDMMMPALAGLSLDGFVVFLNSLGLLLLSQALRFYLPLLLYFLGFAYFAFRFVKYRRREDVPVFLLSLYGLIVYGRTLSGPAYGYLAYGLVPAITLGLLALQRVWENLLASVRAKRYSGALVRVLAMSFCLTWIGSTIENRDLLSFRDNLNIAGRMREWSKNKKYYGRVGFPLSKKSVEQYRLINAYIEEHTGPDEPFFVYPWGPYNHFTKRPSPLAIRDTYDLMAGPFVMSEAVRQLDAARPDLVILNLYNAQGTVTIGASRGDVGDFASWGTLESPCFAGKGNDLESYILGNYGVVKVFDYAAILKRRKTGILFERKFQEQFGLDDGSGRVQASLEGVRPSVKKNVFEITARTAKIEYLFSDPVNASHADLVFVVKNGLLGRVLSKSRITVEVKSTSGSRFRSVTYSDLLRCNRDQDIRLGFSGNAVVAVEAVVVTVESPAPYILPGEIEIKDLRLLLEDRDALMERILSQEAVKEGAPRFTAVRDIAADEAYEQKKTAQQERMRRFEERVVGMTFRGLAKTFVFVLDLERLKKKGVKKVSKMNDAKFKKKYDAIAPFLNELPDGMKDRYGIGSQMTRERVLQNIKSITKEDMFGIIDAVPDRVISNIFMDQLKKDKESAKQGNLAQQIKDTWEKGVSKMP